LDSQGDLEDAIDTQGDAYAEGTGDMTLIEAQNGVLDAINELDNPPRTED